MQIRMPQLGESVTEGTIGKWLKKPGEAVGKYEPLLEVITDKVSAEVPSPAAGVLQEILAAEGETVAVGTPIAVLDQVADEAAAVAEATAAAAGGQAPPAAGVRAAGVVVQSPGAAVGNGSVATLARPEPAARDGQRFSPAVLRLAQEHGIDLTRLSGTGLGGRITRKDVEAAAAARPAAAAPAEAPTAPQPAPATAAPEQEPAQAAGDRAIPVGPVRRRIAQRMTQSVHEIPHAWSMVEVDVTGMVRLREGRKADFQRREGVALTYLPFVVHAVAAALRRHPLLNAAWAEDHIVAKAEVNIGIAVALADALVVPVIHGADRLSVTGLAHAVADLAQRARAGRLTPADVQGGTFTVNNTGTYGSVLSMPIINYPQAAILSTEAIVRRPVVIADDAIAVRSCMNLCLSIDHRVLDGLAAGRFLQSVKERLEALDSTTDI